MPPLVNRLAFVPAVLAFLASTASANQDPFLQVLQQQLDRSFGCRSSLGCSESAVTTTVVLGSTTISAPVHGCAPYSPPIDGAAQVGGHVGHDGVTTVTWKSVQPSTIYIPGAAPTNPSCASWSVKHETRTEYMNGATIVREEPVLTAVRPQTTTKTVTTTSILVPPPSTVVYTSTTTLLLPPVTQTHVSISTTTSVALHTVTSVSTSTSTVTFYAPAPTHHDHAPPCVPGPITPWTAVDIYKGKPFSLAWTDPYPALLRVQDAGYQSERYDITFDGARIGTTSQTRNDRGEWCGISEDAQARLTCLAQGLSHGDFVVPAAKHGHVHNLEIVNIPGVSHDSAAYYSTVYYQLERQCPGQYVPPRPACSSELVQPWKNIDVYRGKDHSLSTFNYPFPVKVTFVDAGYKAEEYGLILDGKVTGWTHSLPASDYHVYCGITPEAAHDCLQKGFASGTAVVPAGFHNVAFRSKVIGDQAGAFEYSTMFYNVEKYCGPF